MNKLYNDTAVQAIANAIRAKNGSSDTYTIAEMSTALNDLSYYAKSTISNVALATFEADGLPLNSLKVSVEAKQDLHGYDKPWVGGAGKNKCNAPSSVSIESGGGNIGSLPCVISSGTYTYSAKTSNSAAFTFGAYNSGGTEIARVSSPSSVTGNHNITFTISESASYIRCYYNAQTTITDIQVESGETATSFAPYSNECPISGWDNAIVTDTDDVDNPTVTQTTTISLGQTVYGGELDVVNGVLKITDGYIASYNGETLPSTWISSMDVYAEGITPTTGAEVCYELANPIIINLTPSLIKSLNGINNLSVDCGDVIELEYFKEV